MICYYLSINRLGSAFNFLHLSIYVSPKKKLTTTYPSPFPLPFSPLSYNMYRYMAPEMHEEKRNYSSKVDIFSLAMVLYEVWEGSKPIIKNAHTCEEFCRLVRKGERPHFLWTPQKIRTIITACWSLHEEERPTAAMVLDMFNAYKIDRQEHACCSIS